MKTINREISDISGIDLAISEQKLLKGGNPNYPICYCYLDGVMISVGYCGTGSGPECVEQLEELYPGAKCFCIGGEE